MRMMENFPGCRVLAYCVMCNHFHLLLEVPPRAIMADKGWEADARHWAGKVSKMCRMLLLDEGQEQSKEAVTTEGQVAKKF
jgi:hypothetical protein